ncbi:hypothetical protein [Corallococcus carmarthensis]|uniref:Uncharacterized protein n=1 Tax=Corallococcus carmarthensis TaxID=2316728 RepID=A0A3A8JIG6_9BACT|nr:hypothetical protein [Corallococcus carmarthensis]NOK21821.1 hypothetical protein [Corallococcus carmarthensis]RKG95537.1 hypothetical protein D7X32_38710 [Corallococcus carmarthensis]
MPGEPTPAAWEPSATVPSSLEVDGRCFLVRVEVPGEALEVDTAAGERVRLGRWGFDAHLWALDRHASVDGQGLHFDATGFAREVMRGLAVPAALMEELAPVALWWAASGGYEAGSGLQEDGWLRAGAVRARLRPWTFVERSRALNESTLPSAGGGQEFRLERYLRLMLRASVVALEPAGVELSMLDGATTVALLDAALALNDMGARDEDSRLKSPDVDNPRLARVTLRLCKALGWTPSQVWETPAAEVDRLLALLEVAEPPAPRPARVGRAPSLADHPDAVVIQVED